MPGEQEQRPPPPRPPPPSAAAAAAGRRLSFDEMIQYVANNKLTCLLFLTRLATLVFTFLHIVPIVTNNSSLSYYQKALLANGATSAIRLQQRLPTFRFNAEFMNLLLAEDSCHYLFYSLIFLYNTPITIVLLPISLFALLHLMRSILTIIDEIGGRGTLDHAITIFLSRYTPVILQTVALSEIFIMPVILLALLTGMGSLVTPFLYYRFITLRYASRRNPYSAQTFRQLRLTIEGFSSRPECPMFIRNASTKLINMTCMLAPARMPVPPATPPPR